jgi:hypothetical protein
VNGVTDQKHHRRAAHHAVPVQCALKGHTAQIEEGRVAVHGQHDQREVQRGQIAENVARVAIRARVLLETNHGEGNQRDEIRDQHEQLADRRHAEEGQNVKGERVPHRVGLGPAHKARIHQPPHGVEPRHGNASVNDGQGACGMKFDIVWSRNRKEKCKIVDQMIW